MSRLPVVQNVDLFLIGHKNKRDFKLAFLIGYVIGYLISAVISKKNAWSQVISIPRTPEVWARTIIQ